MEYDEVRYSRDFVPISSLDIIKPPRGFKRIAGASPLGHMLGKPSLNIDVGPSSSFIISKGSHSQILTSVDSSSYSIQHDPDSFPEESSVSPSPPSRLPPSIPLIHIEKEEKIKPKEVESKLHHSTILSPDPIQSHIIPSHHIEKVSPPPIHTKTIPKPIIHVPPKSKDEQEAKIVIPKMPKRPKRSGK
ncbi:hypothetical protein ADUPG1_012235 [Aduncisulcus paluster]|uniref:Uncharacterized protein n=1 Tax=Aduncisulcus paluster TaxID=2918883 RepID=A0ABQ5K2I3_9EUKA|nr:hypothetical protein ADUPG1_012235 [Aduncisulcus paluster]